jgi:thioredoxin reductase (NADPH)
VTATGTPPAVETPDADGAFPRLTEAQIASLAAEGERRPTDAGQVLYRAGDRVGEFHVVLGGTVALVEGYGGDGERPVGVHGRGRFLGGIGLLTGRPMFLTAVVRDPGEVLVLPAARLRELTLENPTLGDVVVRAYLARNTLLIGIGAGLRIVGSAFDPGTRRLREFAARNRLPHRWIDLERHGEAEQLLRRLHVSPAETPLVLWQGTVLRNPTNAEVARAVGLSTVAAPEGVIDLVIVGAGPAGLAAAVYGASEGLTVIAVDGVATGGQAERSPRIENYLGFPTGLSGADLADRAVVQARKFGAEFGVPGQAVNLSGQDGFHVVGLDDGTTVTARAVLIATGARYRTLDVPRLADFEGLSVHYAATEVEVRTCRGDAVAVVGGGNSAGQAALHLAQQSPTVRLLIRGDDLSASMSRYLIDRIEQSPRIEVRRHTDVVGLAGNGSLEAVVTRDNRTGQQYRLDARALFVFIGAEPHTRWLADRIALDRHGFVLTGADARQVPDGATDPVVDGGRSFLETSRAGVLAVGDVRSGSIKRVAAAVGEGSMAVRLVFEHLAGTERRADR